MRFEKAKPEQGFVKMSMYGPPGSGKTFTTLLLAEGLANGKRIAYVDTERGTDFYAKDVKGRKVHPTAFDFDAIYTRSLLEVVEAVKSLSPEEHAVIVVDSISHLWDSTIAAYEGKKTSQDGIPMQAWGKIKKPYKELIRWLMDAPFHVFILGRQKNIFDTQGGEFQKVGVGMRAEGETEYEPHICARMESRKDENNSSRSTVFAIFEKDRTGILAGHTYSNPTFKTIEPIMPLLNGQQAQSEDPDEVAAKDSELLEREEQKKRDKEEKSRDLFNQFNGEVHKCETLDALAAVAADIKKQKRYMLDAQINSLTEIYKNRRDQLTKAVAPEGV